MVIFHRKTVHAITVPVTLTIQTGAPSLIHGISDRILVNTCDDGCAPVIRRTDNGLYFHRDPVRGTGPGKILWREIPQLQKMGTDDHSVQ